MKNIFLPNLSVLNISEFEHVCFEVEHIREGTIFIASRTPPLAGEERVLHCKRLIGTILQEAFPFIKDIRFFPVQLTINRPGDPNNKLYENTIKTLLDCDAVFLMYDISETQDFNTILDEKLRLELSIASTLNLPIFTSIEIIETINKFNAIDLQTTK